MFDSSFLPQKTDCGTTSKDIMEKRSGGDE
jgi:hypothetical protein